MGRLRSLFRVLSLSILAAVGLGARSSAAYPHFIGLGYSSCIVCHFNPLGNGPLTDYGRALGANEVAAQLTKASPEEVGKASGFLGSWNLPNFIRPSADYRGLILASNLQDDATNRYIHMMADANLVLKFAGDRVVVSGTVGGDPPTPDSGEDWKIISREHYIGYRPARSLGVYAGFMDIAYGVRIPDHVAYSRLVPKVAQNDQTHGMLVHYGSKSFDLALHGFMGNLLQDSVLRQKGGSLFAEFDIGTKTRLGTSFMYTTGDVRKRYFGAVHARLGFGQGSAILAELGYGKDTIEVIDTSSKPVYYMMQTFSRLARGFHFLTTFEYLTDFASEGDRISTWRFGPALQYFPFQRLELRMDLVTSRSFNAPVVAADAFSAYGQVHVYF